MSGTLIVLTGPTGVGKTELSLQLAEHYGCPIVSADSRQFYRDIPIGTAAPTAEQLARVKHYFVGQLALTDYYSASCYEEEVLRLLDTLFTTHDYVLLTGGSMMYIDAVCKGIDDIPTITDEIRREVVEHYRQVGLEALCEELKRLDPVYYNEVDLKNHKRVIHAIEICRQTGGRYSDLRTRQVKERPFRIVKIGLIRPREELFERIARRTGQMISDGLLDEARRVYPLRHLNSLNSTKRWKRSNAIPGSTPKNRLLGTKRIPICAGSRPTIRRRLSGISMGVVSRFNFFVFTGCRGEYGMGLNRLFL